MRAETKDVAQKCNGCGARGVNFGPQGICLHCLDNYATDCGYCGYRFMQSNRHGARFLRCPYCNFGEPFQDPQREVTRIRSKMELEEIRKQEEKEA